jgi:chemosensory pili system protein ChpC
VSKKKRNRRPHPPAATGTPQAASGAVALAELDEADEAPVEAAAPVQGTEPVVALAQDTSAARPPAAAATPSAPAPATSAGWVPHESGDIRGVLIQVGGGRLLLPNATIAEVLSYAEPEPVEASADWLLGRFRWRGWQLPLIAFSRLAGIGQEQPGLGSKVIVLKALGGDRRIPYFAILTQGFPRLVTVSRSALEVEARGEALPDAIQARVRLNDEPALLPDLLRIEHLLQAQREAA